jgi:hypothetical protein
MSLKLLYYLLLILFIPQTAWTQFNENAVINIPNNDKKLLNWGYFIGFNQFDYQTSFLRQGIGDTQILVEKTVGFNLGLIGEIRINDFLDLRLEPGFHSGKRNLIFKIQSPSPIIENDSIRSLKSAFIDLPLLIKFSAKRIANWRPFLIGGPYVSYNLSSNSESTADNSGGIFKTEKWNYGYQIGVGIDFYLPYFKFTPSLRGAFALNDDAIRDEDPSSPWTSNIDKMRSRGLFLVFTFE